MHVKKVDKIVLHLVTLELLPVFTVYLRSQDNHLLAKASE